MEYRIDANILMRAVLGRRVRELLETYEDAASFYSPDVCLDDARHYVAQALEKRGLNPESGLSVLAQLNASQESESHDELGHEPDFKTCFHKKRLPCSRRAQLKVNTFLVEQTRNDIKKVLRLGITLRP